MIKNKLYTYLGFSARSRTLVTGVTGVELSIKRRKAHLVILGCEVGINTREKMATLCKKYNVPYYVFGDCNTLCKITGTTGKGVFAMEEENLAKAAIDEIEKVNQERRISNDQSI